MSSDMTNNYIINPYTNRLIKKNSKTYQRLIAAKLLNEKPSAPEENIIIKTKSSDEAKEIQSKLNKNLQKNKVITRRGNAVLKANRRPTRKEITDKVSDYATEVVIDNRDELFESEMTDVELDEYIKSMIQNKLVGNNVSKVSKKPNDIYHKKPLTNNQNDEQFNESDQENDY